MLAAVKPTVGRISRYGVIPITADQDTAGPMAKTVTDVALMLGAMESPAPDPNDPATKTCTAPANRDYTPFLKADGLKGARIGIPRAFFYDRINPPSRSPDGGREPEPTAEGRDRTTSGGSREATGAPYGTAPRDGAGPPSATAPGATTGPGPGGFLGRGGGLTPEQARVMTEAIHILKQQGGGHR